jgi:hypothetical protein
MNNKYQASEDDDALLVTYQLNSNFCVLLVH